MGEAGEALCLGHLGSAALQKILVLIGNHVPGWVWRVQQSQCGGSGRVECCRGFTRNSDKTPSVCYSEGPVPTRNTREQINDYFKPLSWGCWLWNNSNWSTAWSQELSWSMSGAWTGFIFLVALTTLTCWMFFFFFLNFFSASLIPGTSAAARKRKLCFVCWYLSGIRYLGHNFPWAQITFVEQMQYLWPLVWGRHPLWADGVLYDLENVM